MVVDNADEVLRGAIERSMLVPTCLARLLAAGVVRVEYSRQNKCVCVKCRERKIKNIGIVVLFYSILLLFLYSIRIELLFVPYSIAWRVTRDC